MDDDLRKTEDTAAIERAARAIVYLTVEWSGPERIARQAVHSALESLPDLGFSFFVVQEDGPLTGPWLIARGWTKHPMGCGSVLWFEGGKQVGKELRPGVVGAEAVVRKTLELWGGRGGD